MQISAVKRNVNEKNLDILISGTKQYLDKYNYYNWLASVEAHPDNQDSNKHILAMGLKWCHTNGIAVNVMSEKHCKKWWGCAYRDHIDLNPHMAPGQESFTFVHEIAHIIARHYECTIMKKEKELVAEAVAYLVHKDLGINKFRRSTSYIGDKYWVRYGSNHEGAIESGLYRQRSAILQYTEKIIEEFKTIGVSMVAQEFYVVTDIQNQVEDVLKFHHMPLIPDWRAIPPLMGMTHETLKYRRASLSDIIGVLEAVFLSLKQKVHGHMGDDNDWTKSTILMFGSKLLAIDAHLEMAGNALFIHGNMDETESHLWPVLYLVKETWNELFNLGCID